MALAIALSGCSTTAKRSSIDPEEFDSTTTHTRHFGASQAQTCEAGRRALLSQGYLVTVATADAVTGRKSFQPSGEVHVEVELRVVCARDGGDNQAIAFVSALQDRYSLKKVNNSASVGVGALGSVSLPFSSSDDALVKVASETLTDELFYDRFFTLLSRFISQAPTAAEPRPTDLRSLPQPTTETPLSPVPVSPSRG